MPREIDPGIIKKGSGLANQDSVDSNSFTEEVVENQSKALSSHLNDPQGAHPASAISTTGSGGAYFGDDVQANLDELSGLVPAKPPTVGNLSTFVNFNGIPDWGELKLKDGGFVQRGDVAPPVASEPNSDAWVYQEYWTPPYLAQNIFSSVIAPNPPGDVFTIPGNDPASDSIFNIADGVYSGGGPGKSHQGGFTRGVAIVETSRAFNTSASTHTVVSGNLFPADRGVLALFHWPAGGDVASFLAQNLTERVVAAVVCGKGALSDCDGDPGGIFAEGAPDISSFPGRIAGQYDLVELHKGMDDQTGDPLPDGPNPSAGQVRLGSDASAGVPLVPGGIPILGATTVAVGGGDDNNFFRYRLPYLTDYSAASGIVNTPAVQRPRYFTKPAVSLDPGTDLTNAGSYEGFPQNYVTFQVGKYRHRFDRSLYGMPDNGSYLLLHFKRERDFEAFSRDGIMPDDPVFGYELWSAGMQNFDNPESVDNLVDTSDPLAPLTSPSYHVHRSAVYEDADLALSNISLGYTFDSETDEVMFVSGVQYFLPNGTGVGTNWQIDTLSWSVEDLFNPAYLLGDSGLPAPEETPGLWHREPVLLYLGAGTADANILNGLGTGYTGTSTYQRVSFNYTDLDSVSGPFDLSSGPPPGATADVVLAGADTPIRFAGDASQCHFWSDARVRVFARKPQNQEDSATPNTTTEFPSPGGFTLLVHTTNHSPSLDGGGSYGNFKTTNPGDFPPRPSLETARKDVEERFYDEVYRVADSLLPTVDASYDAALLVGNVVGPGLPFPAFGPIELPVRFASESLVSFGSASYLRNDLHLLDLSSDPSVATEAQVSGLPDRNPPATDGVANPCPFSGMLVYPKTDYSATFRPSTGSGDVTTAQPDYSTVADPQRVYIRAFDAAYSTDTTPEPGVIGQPFLTFRIDGLQLADFAYVGPGPGNGLTALEIKIPGLTTWMDMGRTDLDGPSKQDALTDGAGCQILDPSVTFDGRDAVTGTVFCQVRVNVGPSANVFANTGIDPLAPLRVAPVLVRARIFALGTSQDFTQGGPSSNSDVPRALTGITLLRHSNGLGPDAAAPFGPPSFP